MKTRKAFDLNNWTRIYNLIQIVSCTWLVTRAFQLGFSVDLLWKCRPAPTADDEITDNMREIYKCYWWCICLRTSEFLETIVFVLRKKKNQVSFLHIYHHIAVVTLMWIFLKYHSGESESVIGVINSAVHVMMYSYYFLSSFKVFKKATQSVKSLITSVQIVQLVVLFLHCFHTIASCNMTKLYYLQAGNLAFLVFMFFKFYAKNYSKKNV
jgi:GNS1/SUR4 family